MADDPKVREGNEGTPNDGLKIGDKVYKAEEVENLVNQQASLTQESQKLAAIRSAAEKYGISVEDYVKNAEGSFYVTSKLMEAGVIDEKGNLLKEPKVKVDDKGNPDEAGNLTHQQVISQKDSRVDAVLGALESINKKLDTYDADHTNLLKLGLKRDVMLKHQDLTDAEALAVLNNFEKDPHRTVWDHAEDMLKEKAAKKRTEEEAYAKHFGIDIDEWRNRNNQNIQGQGEGAAAFLGERKVIFGHRKPKGTKEGFVTPKEAMMEFLGKQKRG